MSGRIRAVKKKRKKKAAPVEQCGAGDGIHGVADGSASQTDEDMAKEDLDEIDVVAEPLFPLEANAILKNQIDALEEEKESLSERLRLAEDKLEEAKAASPLRNLGRSSDLAANKIVELGKKVRELTAELARANSRADAAEVKLKESSTCNTPNSDTNKASQEIQELTEKLNATNTKLCETRNQCQQLKHELKIAHKTLSNELGDNVSLQSTLSAGWRGRAQQILSLQHKVNELTEKLANNQNKSPISTLSSLSKADKSKEIELTKELEAVKLELEDSKKKLEVTKSRLRAASNEAAMLRSRSDCLAEKSSNDQKIIATLNAQLASNNQEKSKCKDEAVIIKLEQQLNNLKKDLNQEKVKNEHLASAVTDKDSKISSLQAKINSLSQSPPPQPTEKPSSNGAPSRNSSVDKDSSQSQYTPNAAAVEAERLRLMELLAINNRRLEEERSASDKAQDLLRQERHRCARLETKVARLELERVGWTKGLYKKPQTKNTVERGDADWDALKDKAELLEEKCLALESRLKCLQQEKEEDNKKFMVLIEETRNSYLENKKGQIN